MLGSRRWGWEGRRGSAGWRCWLCGRVVGCGWWRDGGIGSVVGVGGLSVSGGVSVGMLS